jgi:hypothetical protein
MGRTDRLKLIRTEAECSCGFRVGRIVQGTTQVLCLDCKSLIQIEDKR